MLPTSNPGLIASLAGHTYTYFIPDPLDFPDQVLNTDQAD